MTASRKDPGPSIGGDTAADEQRDMAMPELTPTERAKYAQESEGVPDWDSDSHIG
jgi:hypothetical protein